MTQRQRLADTAGGYLGVPFRLHGRDPRIGLDCVGLVAVCLEEVGARPLVPTGYALRNRSIESWLNCADRSSLAPATGAAEAGDILLLRPGPHQHHLAIDPCDGSIIHAHAGLRRVVRQPFNRSTRVLARWQLID
ncbi:MAG: NlpC/P60 family protein [Pseudomonadota bacterium]